eukprot:scaffold7805_cov153-Amphora_coffeaeformis.AAC.3
MMFCSGLLWASFVPGIWVDARVTTSQPGKEMGLSSAATTKETTIPPPPPPLQLEYEEWNPHRRSLLNKPRPSQIVNYTVWKPEDIAGTLTRWGEHYSDLIQVTTSQEAYDLPTAGTDKDCPFNTDSDGCVNYVATIQDYITYPPDSEAGKRLPEVLLSGCLHGNEQVGPSAVMETAALLLEAASCTAYPRWSLKDKSPTEWENDLNRAKECRQEWRDYGYEDWQREWLARLVATRRIVIVPTANALGYYQNVREENRIDPNRDFPYDLTDPTQCMQTIAGRTLNEVFREHIFQMSLTFHAGMEVVGYEWGAPTYKGGLSPDDVAQSQIGDAYSRFGGGFATSRPYNNGPMNDLVYPVRGGMEDWAYAGSWDPDRVVQCKPTTYGGYPASQTKYDDATLRAFNMLVETSNNKMPKNYLGSTVDVLSATQAENGHIARNLRLALLAIELVQPWAAFRQVNEVVLTDDIIPHLDRGAGRQVCQRAKHVVVPRDSKKVTIQWEVGGSLTIEDTRVWYAKWSDLSDDKLDCLNQPKEDITKWMREGTAISKSSGTTRFAQQQAGFSHFSASIDISGYQPHDLIVVLVSATVDQEWGQMPNKYFLPKNTPPRSHMANARTNSEWHYESTTSGHIVQGRVVWFSDPLTVELSEIKSATSVKTVELSERVPMGPQPGVRPGDEAASPTKQTSPKTSKPWTPAEKFVMVLIFFVTIVFTVVGGRYFLRIQMRQTHRERLREFIANPTAPSPGLKDVSDRGSGRGRRKRGKGRSTATTDDDADLANGNGDLELKVYRDDADKA